MSSAAITPGNSASNIASWATKGLFLPLHVLMNGPVLLLLATLTLMLFRPPDVQFYSVDRIAFGVLVFVVGLRTLLLRERWIVGPVTAPLVYLFFLGLVGVVTQPFEAQAWSVFATKWVVPLAFCHLAGLVLVDSNSLRKFEVFCWIVLTYLCAIAILSFLGFKEFIFPTYITDSSIGIHADRARGPFLQAVANGVTLNLLALLALNSFRRRTIPTALGSILLISVPIAVAATKTRAVWASIALSVAWLSFSRNHRIRFIAVSIAVLASVVLLLILGTTDISQSLTSRLREASPVDFRLSVYRAGWDMFWQRPILGWPSDAVQPELSRRINDFHQEAFYFHNTFLEIAVAHGMLGLVLYLWLVVGLFRLTTPNAVVPAAGEKHFCDSGFRKLWPLLLIIYFLNASFVVMNYQFVNGLLFTLAGLLMAQNRDAKQRLLPREI